MTDQVLTRAEQSRNSILAAAHDLLVRQGYHGTSMRQIADRAGVALGGLYNQFDSKERVFEAVFLEYHPYHQVIPALLAARANTIEEFSRDGFHRLINAMQDHPEFLNLMFIEAVEFNSVHAGELFARLVPEIAKIVSRVIEVNRDRMKQLPPFMLVRFYFGLFFAYFLTDKVFAQQAPPEFREGAVEYFMDMFLYGVMRRDGDESVPSGSDAAA